GRAGRRRKRRGRRRNRRNTWSGGSRGSWGNSSASTMKRQTERPHGVRSGLPGVTGYGSKRRQTLVTKRSSGKGPQRWKVWNGMNDVAGRNQAQRGSERPLRPPAQALQSGPRFLRQPSGWGALSQGRKQLLRLGRSQVFEGLNRPQRLQGRARGDFQ